MHKSPLFADVLITMIMTASLVSAQTPEGVEPGVWAKVEAQLEAQGVQPAGAKAGRDVPVEVAKLLPTPDLLGDYAIFGRAIAADGELMVVGARDDDQGTRAGAVFVFSRHQGGTNTWGQVAKLTASDGASEDYFGHSVDICGNTVVIGAPIGDDDDGSAYVFGRDQGGPDAWGQITKLVASDGASGDNFGISVGLSGDTAVVGARRADINGLNTGSAYIFERNHGGTDVWGQVSKLLASDGVPDDGLGHSVSISDNTVVVGSNLFADTAYVYDRDMGGSDAWGEVAKLVASDGMTGGGLGYSVSISGDTIVVGAPQDNENGYHSGSAYVFGRDEGGPDAWCQVTKLVASDGAMIEYFGISVGLSGDTAVVGAHGDDENGYSSGSASVFGRDHGGADAWGQVAKITPSDGAEHDTFGRSVSISDDTLVVGAREDDDNGIDSGSAYIFDRNQGGPDTWGQVAKQVAPGYFYDPDDMLFGSSVSISGNTVVVGTYGDRENGFNSGSASIFGRNQGGAEAWGFVFELKASDGAIEDQFGNAVSISGDTVVVGAYGDDDNGNDSGSVYIFGRNHGGTDAWGQVAKITPSDGAELDYFGKAVSISSDTVVVGTYGDNDNGFNSGSAYIFGRNHGGADAWGQVAKITPSDGAYLDNFGIAVSISGDTVVIGAYGDDDNGFNSGSVYVFGKDQGGTDAWGAVGKLTASDGASGDNFGVSVGLSDDTAVVGAHSADNNGLLNTGSAYIFERIHGGTDAWGQVAKITASDGASYDRFGYSASISGNTVVAGALYDDDNGHDSGSAYLFGRNQGGADAWGEVGKLTASDGVQEDYFGTSISISGDSVVVGAPENDHIGTDSGSAYIFNILRNLEVQAVGTTPGTGDGVLVPGEWAGVAITDFSVLFSKTMLDPAGDSDPSDVTNPSNWLLVSAGSDGIVETTSCAGGIAGDDGALAPDNFVYTDAELTVTFRAAGGAALADGAYTLFACGTLESTLGLQLDGNGDGIGGDDFALPFAIDTVMPTNPVLSSPSHTVGVWSNDPTIVVNWSGGADAHSGVGGYSVVMDISAATVPDAVIDIAHSADPHTVVWEPPADGDSWYYHLRTCDVAGNCAAAQHLGPLWIDATPPTTVTDLISTSHTVGVPLHDATIDVQWTAATDNLNGVDGYAVEFSMLSSWACDAVQDTTTTATTSETLGDGEWYVHICAVDGIGNWGDVDSAGPFVIDSTAPIVAAVASEGGTIDGTLGEGESALAAITQLEVAFSEVISNPAGDDTPGDLTNPQHYRVLNLGPDGLLTTVDCSSALGGDDVEIPQGGLPFAWPGNQSVSIPGLAAQGLAAGRYTLMLCGLQDLAGHELVGPWIRSFAISANNLLLDPNFEDGALGAWDTVSPGGSDILWADADTSTPASGVVVIDPIGSAVGETFELTQCLDVVEGTPFVLGGISRIDSTEPSAPTLKAMARYYRNAGCTDELEIVETVFAQGDTAGAWSPRLYLSSRTPIEALSARVGFIVEGGTAADFTLSIDEAAFFEETFFVDGFEIGDEAWWSVSQP